MIVFQTTLIWHYTAFEVNLCKKNSLGCLTWYYSVLDVNVFLNMRGIREANNGKNKRQTYIFWANIGDRIHWNAPQRSHGSFTAQVGNVRSRITSGVLLNPRDLAFSQAVLLLAHQVLNNLTPSGRARKRNVQPFDESSSSCLVDLMWPVSQRRRWHLIVDKKYFQPLCG